MMRIGMHTRGALGAALLAGAVAAGTGAGTAAAAGYPVIYGGAHGWQETGYARTIGLPASGTAAQVLRLQPWHFGRFTHTLAAASSGRLRVGGRSYAVDVAAFGIRARGGVRYFAHLVVYVGSRATEYYRWNGRWRHGQ